MKTRKIRNKTSFTRKKCMKSWNDSSKSPMQKKPYFKKLSRILINSLRITNWPRPIRTFKNLSQQPPTPTVKADKSPKPRPTPTTPCKRHKTATTHRSPKTRKAKPTNFHPFPPKQTQSCPLKNPPKPIPNGSLPSNKATTKANSKSNESNNHMPSHWMNFRIKLPF